MTATRLLAITGQGIARALETAGGQWRVEQVPLNVALCCLALDPVDPDVVYAGAARAGVLRSVDGGCAWQPSGLAGRTVTALAVSPAAPSVIFAGTRPAHLFVSRDSGATWDELPGFRAIPHRRWWFSPAGWPFTARVQAIAPAGDAAGHVVVGIEAGATVRTVDGGATWSRHLAGALRDCHTLVAHPTDPNWLYEAGGTGAGVAVSRDGGRTWAQPRAGLDRHYAWSCVADPADPRVWYVSAAPSPWAAHGDGKARAAIFRTRGGPWERLTGGLADPLEQMPYSLLTDPDRPGCLYAGLANGHVWRSLDHGDSWQRLPLDLGPLRRVLVRA